MAKFISVLLHALHRFNVHRTQWIDRVDGFCFISLSLWSGDGMKGWVCMFVWLLACDMCNHVYVPV